MLAGSEWLIIVVGAGLLAGLLWLVVRAARGNGTPVISRARVRGSAGDVLDDLQLATAGLPRTITRREAPGSLTAEWTYIPAWAFVVAVLLFPIGLIALVARTSVLGTVIVTQESEGIAAMEMGGIFNKATARAIDSVIASRS